MLYTLIIITALMPTNGAAGGSFSGFHVPGFSSEQACVNAGNKVQIPANGKYHETKAIFTCVKMGV